jgi:aspartyl protease family protein
MRKVYILLLFLLSLSITSCRYRVRHDRSTYQNYSAAPSRNEGRQTDVEKHGKCIIPIQHQDGVLLIPAKVNDIPMKFIFDTGASTISMSLTEANFLVKQGNLTQNDIEGNTEFMDANGNISEGCVINLKKVQIGDAIIHNVKASVVMNQDAPLLFGQTALSKFGKVSIDYNNNQLILE